MSASKSLKIPLLEIMNSSKDECVFIRDLSDLALPNRCDTWWASTDVGTKGVIV